MKNKRPFPMKFSIKGAVWRVKFRKTLVADDGDPAKGLTDFDTRTIYLDRSLTEPHLEWVFWHEYAHAVLYEAGVVGNTGGLEDLTEEIICDNIADAMTRDKKVKWKRLRRLKL